MGRFGVACGRWGRRGLLLVLAFLLAGGALAAALGGGAPAAVVPAPARPRASDDLAGHGMAASSHHGSEAAAATEAAEALSARLAALGVAPGGLLGLSPGEGLALRRLAGPFDALPLPEPSEHEPLRSAIEASADALGLPRMPALDAEAALAQLDLGADGQRALAQLLLAHAQAVSMRREATAALTAQERAFLALDGPTVLEWLSQDASRTWGDYEQEALRIVAQKVDSTRTLQAADLLVRAVEATRGPLANDPKPVAGWPVPSIADLAAVGHGGNEAPPVPFADAWGGLHVALGGEPWAAPVPRLHPTLEAALGPVLAAKLRGLQTGDALAEADAAYRAAIDARPTLEAWAALLHLQDRRDQMVPAGPAPLVPAGAPSIDVFRAALDAAVATLDPDSRAALLTGAEAHELLQRDSWTPQEAAIVRDWARAHEPLRDADLEALQRSASPLAVLPDDDGDGCADQLQSMAPLACALARLATAEGTPLPDPVPPMEPQQASSPVPVPGVLFDDAVLGPQSLLCEAPKGSCIGPASLLRIGGTDAQTYTWPALVHVDLGGDDRHESEVAGPAFVRPRELCADGGAAGQRCAPPPCPAGASCTMPAGSYAIDVEGDDVYATPGRNLTQGATFGRGASLLIDLAGDDVYEAGEKSQGYGGRGIGLLIDVAGNDRYAAGDKSQGAAMDLIGENLANAPDGSVGVSESFVPSWGSLADLAGDDQYAFAQQASLLDTYGLAVLLDANGTDTYASMQQALDPELLANSPGLAFLTQGRFVGTSAGLAAGLALFADRGLEQDTYLTLDQEGGLADVSAAKNQQALRPNGANGQGDVPGYGFFHDGDPVDPDERKDHDGDGVPTAAEKALGTDPADRGSNPGNLFFVLTGGTLGEPGPTGMAGMDRPGPWLATPTQGPAPVLGTVSLPGVVVGGRADDTHATWVPFLVDLGGDDAYVAPFAGGASPLATGLFTAVHRANDLPPTDVTLLLDVGAGPDGDGQDTYAPDPDSCTIVRNDANGYAAAAGDAAVRSGPTFAFPAACPALGGAHNGIAILADDGGRNTFRSALSIDVNANTPVGAGGRTVANVAGYGVMQGAALFDGVGVLLTWDAANDFDARVRVRAVESGSTAFGPFAPQARAVGLAQGAALGGVGILAAMGAADDVYASNVTAQAVQASGVDAAAAAGASQGAGLSGVGVLFDEGGADHWSSPAGSSQGFGAGSAQPSNTVAGGSPPATSRQTVAGMPAANSGLGTSSRPTLGLLWVGDGDDALEAGPGSQGASTGHAGFAFSVVGNLEPGSGGSGILGALVDTGGNDRYRLLLPAGRPGLGQGAGARQGVGVLLELDGDDLYEAANATHVQGVGVRGVGILDDRGGHDRYIAAARSQGYGEHDGIDMARAAFGTPTPQGANANTMLSANSWDLSGPDVTLGFLRDGSGWDAYVAQALSQGAADVVLHDLANVDSCVSSVPSAVFAAGSIVVSACDQLGQHCASLVTPQPVAVPNPDTCRPPGQCPTTTGLCEDVPNRQQCVAAAGTRQCVDTATQVACIGPCPDAVVGLLVDGGGDDAYDYPGPKCALQPDGTCAPGPAGGDGWRWTQPTAIPLARGVGADDETVDGALAGALGQLPGSARDRLPARVTVGLARDPAGTDPIPPGAPAHGTVHLVADVQVSAPLGPEDVHRVDFLIDGRLAGAGTPVPGSPGRFALEWATRTPQDTGQVQVVPDGGHTIVASAFVAQDGVSRRTGRAALSSPSMNVESEPMPVEIDNPPLLSAILDQGIVAPAMGRHARLELHLAPDAAGSDQAVQVKVIRVQDGEEWVLDEQARPPGSFGLTFDGDECGGPCADGRHVVVASAIDAEGQEGFQQVAMVYDRLEPTSAVGLPPVASDRFRSGANGLLVPWSHSDLPLGLGAGNGSGVAAVRLLMLDGDDTVLRDLGEHDARVTSVTILGVFNGDSLRFISVARDGVGHSESPCLAGEPAPCYRAKLARPGSVQEVLLDYGRPSLSDLSISRTQVPPGGAATFVVRAGDAESGLAAVDLRFDHGFPDTAMVAAGDGTYRAVVASHARGPGAPPVERPFVFTAAAVDQAGNERLRSGVGILDDRAPRLAPLPLDYGAPGAVAAQTPSLVRASVRVQDAAVAWVGLDATELLGGDDPLDCILDAAANAWTCDLVVPEGAADGEYGLVWHARDAAGNENRSAMSQLQVTGSRPRLAGIEVDRVFHDGFAIRWTSDLPGTARLQYGRDDRTESSATNATCAAAADACSPYLHEVEVRGLPSATDFFVRAVTVGRSGMANASEALIVRTGHSFLLAASGLEAGDALHGVVDLDLQVESLDGSSAPILLSVLLQDEAGRASPLQVHQQALDPGSTTVRFDSRQASDGPYRLVLEGVRSGERVRVASDVVRVDNTEPVLSPLEPRPGTRVATATPRLLLSVLDPAAAAPLALQGLTVTVDGQPVEATARAVSPWAAGSPQRVEVLMATALAEGARDVSVQLPDQGGNVGVAVWSFVVDTKGPALRSASVVYPAGQDAVAPGGTVRLLANLTDATGVAGATVDGLTPAVAFLDAGAGTWTTQLQVPATRPDGTWLVPVRATDRLGTASLVTIPVLVDAKLPGLVVATTEAAGHTSLRLRVQADEPVALRASSAVATAASAARASEHVTLLEGLAPGRLHAVEVELVDRAGNRAAFLLNGTTPRDDTAPGPVLLNASSPGEGLVVLRWTPASDNAGIQAYRVERRADQWSVLGQVGANRTSYEDPQAPLGRLAHYRVTAIDVAGLASPPVEALVRVTTLPHLEAPQVEPRVARADEDVTFSVLYRHGGGRAPDAAHVQYLDLVVPLAVAADQADCAAGCRLEATARLPPAVLGGPVPEAVFVVSIDGHEARLALGEPPRILAHDQALRPEGADVPGLGAFHLLAALAAAALLHLRRQRT